MFGIRDQACLNTLAHPSGTTSSWLKAILEPVLVVHPWPRIYYLTLSLARSFCLFRLCTCLSSFGDHHLGCSHGPIRIQRHDALVNTVYNSFLQDHPGVLKEQRASSDDGFNPSDVFHPDIQHG